MMEDIEFYCSYPVCMALKKDGYDRLGCSIYTNAVRYNGKDIDYETELDLKFEGKAKLIKRIPGESIAFFNLNNSLLDLYGAKKDCVRVSQACAMEWLRQKHQVHIMVDRIDGKGEKFWYGELVDLKSPFRKGVSLGITPYVGSYEEAVEKALMKFYHVRTRKNRIASDCGKNA
jgi:hypothetical protein